MFAQSDPDLINLDMHELHAPVYSPIAAACILPHAQAGKQTRKPELAIASCHVQTGNYC